MRVRRANAVWRATILLGAVLTLTGPLPAASPDRVRYDLIIRNGMIYDGSGDRPYRGDVAIIGDKVAYVGAPLRARARRIVDARGLAIAPGFINSLSWGTYGLLTNPDAANDLRQGVTLEILNEGTSPGPRHSRTTEELATAEAEVPEDFKWRTFGDYMTGLERRGVSVNFAGWVGASTVRANILENKSAKATSAQLAAMRGLVREAMEEGALGVSSALIYTPGLYATTDELAGLAQEAGRCGGMYISHIRSEGNHFLEAIDEVIAIARQSGAPAEVLHIKVGDPRNWHKMPVALERIDQARSQGLRITANIYPYTASGTGLTASMPPWLQDGGIPALTARLRDPELRARAIREMQDPDQPWENVMRGAGGAEGVLIASLADPELQSLSGKTLAEIAELWGVIPEEAALRLVEQDGSRVGAIYSTMLEDNLVLALRKPYVSVGSDGGVMSDGGKPIELLSHPRGFGTFARIFARYVREKNVLTVEEAVRRLTSLPATKYGIQGRGALKPGNFADVVVFDPGRIQDHASYTSPREVATGVSHVFVNGIQVLKDGNPTKARPGRYLRGRAATDGGCRSSVRDWSWDR